MAKIAVVGSLNMDLVAVTPRIPVAGETIIGKNFFTVPGGKGANQAYAAAKLGGETAMIGRVGSDDFGQAMRKNLADVGCNVTGVRNVDGPSGVALIFVAESGANSIVVAPAPITNLNRATLLPNRRYSTPALSPCCNSKRR